jgi:integrase
MVCIRSHKQLTIRLQLNFRLYDFRHTFGSRAAMAGVDLPTLKELMGHSSITTTMRYVHPTPEHKRAAMEKVAKYNRGTPKITPSDRMEACKSLMPR